MIKIILKLYFGIIFYFFINKQEETFMIKFKKWKKQKPEKVSLTKGNIIAIVVFLILEAIFYYATFPSLNIHNGEFWGWILITLVALIICTMNFKIDRKAGAPFNQGPRANYISKYGFIVVGVLIVVLIIGSIISSPLFMSSKYASLINIKNGDFTTDIVESEDISNIALMDTDSARIIGDRAIGSLSDVVSQYEVSKDYSTIDYNGRPMKVASLNYAGFFKYFNNKSEGIPGYVLVDPVKNEAKYVKLEKSIKYSPSAYFNDNLQRHVQMAYPTSLFEGYYLELDNDGNPYYICPTLKANAGLFGAKDVKGVVICDPCTGDMEYYDVADVPSWVDRVYDGSLACQKFDWYGELSGGYINSVIGNKGCKKTTEDYGYKVMNGDVWVYTGVTSVNGDESNIGFVMINLRTGESKYYSIAGAEEFSAMSSAEGQVQHLGYKASFPSLINIKGIPTYIMVLKDNAGLVKMYALVNVEKYNIVATGTTQKDALSAYNKLLAENNILSSGEITDDIPSEKITVKDIKYILLDGETYVYITDSKNSVYKQKFSENEELIFIQTGDIITVYYDTVDGEILNMIGFTK